jgi:hypothetical protein
LSIQFQKQKGLRHYGDIRRITAGFELRMFEKTASRPDLDDFPAQHLVTA